MSENIYNVNLPKFKVEMETYNQNASQLSGVVIEMSDNLNNLRSFWSGRRINTVINLWNSKCDAIIEQVSYFDGQINSILRDIYSQYCALEAGKPKDSKSGAGWGTQLKVALTDENTIRFSEVQAKNLMNELASQNQKIGFIIDRLTDSLDSMSHYSDSLKSLHAHYTSVANDLKSSLTHVCKLVESEAGMAFRDTMTTEGYNQVDAARAKKV